MSGLRLRAALEWEVVVDEDPGTNLAHAISYPPLTPPLREGDRVLLNTAAAALGLGSGGFHQVIARLDRALEEEPFAGREAGHQFKLRYTPVQHRVLCVEDEESPHRAAIEACAELDGAPVVCCELHSQAAAAAIAAHAAAPGLRLVYVMTDSAALALGFSRLAHALREQGVLAATITAGQAFGGDHETVNVHTALLAARAVAGADVILVGQGPGNAGTGTRYGFSGLALLEALHTAAAFGGRPVLAARLSFADPRPRHRGLSHHLLTLASLARCPVEIPLPLLAAQERHRLEEQLAGAGPPGEHAWPWIDATPAWPALAAFLPPLTSMGRALDEDRQFFLAAAAAGLRAVQMAGG